MVYENMLKSLLIKEGQVCFEVVTRGDIVYISIEQKALNQGWQEAEATASGEGVGYATYTQATPFNPSYSPVGGHRLFSFTQDVTPRWLVTALKFL